jgi:hypothetical protein
MPEKQQAGSVAKHLEIRTLNTSRQAQEAIPRLDTAPVSLALSSLIEPGGTATIPGQRSRLPFSIHPHHGIHEKKATVSATGMGCAPTLLLWW